MDMLILGHRKQIWCVWMECFRNRSQKINLWYSTIDYRIYGGYTCSISESSREQEISVYDSVSNLLYPYYVQESLGCRRGKDRDNSFGELVAYLLSIGHSFFKCRLIVIAFNKVRHNSTKVHFHLYLLMLYWLIDTESCRFYH